MTSAFVSLLFLLAKGYTSVHDHLESTATRVLYITSDRPDALNSIRLELNDHAPVIVSMEDGLYEGIEWDTVRGPEPWYTPYGRFFTQEEMELGENVAILSTGYIASMSKEERDALWDNGITVQNALYQVIGNYYSEFHTGSVPTEMAVNEALSRPIVVPLRSFLNTGLTASSLRCEFPRSMSPAELDSLRGLLAQQDVSCVFFPQPAKRGQIYLNSIFPTALLVVLALLSMITVVLSWLNKDKSRDRIYRLCGATDGNRMFMLLIHVCLLVTIAYLPAVLIARIMTGLVGADLLIQLPSRTLVLAYLCFLAFSCLTVLGKQLLMSRRKA